MTAGDGCAEIIKGAQHKMVITNPTRLFKSADEKKENTVNRLSKLIHFVYVVLLCSGSCRNIERQTNTRARTFSQLRVPNLHHMLVFGLWEKTRVQTDRDSAFN